MKQKKIKVLLIFGTRPEAIKLAPVILQLQKLKNEFDLKVCITGQHKEMLDQALNFFSIVPDYNLNIMRKKQDLFDVTSSVILGVKKIIIKENPKIVLVHGDTTTTFASALAAFYLNVKVGHIEAGLRTYDIKQPFPEEFNRQITSKLSHWHFAPTTKSKQNLLNENVNSDKIVVTGNTVIDTLFLVKNKIESTPKIKKSILVTLKTKLNFNISNSKYILITGHRRENFGTGFLEICEAINDLAEKYSRIDFVYPVHLNPNVLTPVNNILTNKKNIHLINPVNYDEFVFLLYNCYLVLTDSGGIQEEAPSLGKPVLVMRSVTERPEGIAAGVTKLVGANKSSIFENVSNLITNAEFYNKMSKSVNPYGDGTATKTIIKKLREILIV